MDPLHGEEEACAVLERGGGELGSCEHGMLGEIEKEGRKDAQRDFKGMGAMCAGEMRERRRRERWRLEEEMR